MRYFEMINGITTTQLLRCKEKIDSIKKDIDSAVRIREETINNKSNSKELDQIDSYYDPETYYKFRILNKAVWITITNKKFENGKAVQTREKYYGIKVYGFTPKQKTTKNTKYLAEVYGSFEKLEDAINEYKNFCVDMLEACGMNFNDEVLLFK